MGRKEPKSIIDGDRAGECFMCKQCGDIQLHHIYKGKNRKVSDKHGFVVHLCSDCHSFLHGNEGHLMDIYLQKTCQLAFEENHNRERFMELIGRNYIEEDED